jgi:hypothetical protein
LIKTRSKSRIKRLKLNDYYETLVNEEVKEDSSSFTEEMSEGLMRIETMAAIFNQAREPNEY